MYSIVIPVYKNEETIEPLFLALEDLRGRLRGPMEVVFVVDGSPDRSFALLRQNLEQVKFSAELVLLSRNFGALAATRAGLGIASGSYFAVIAADLQEPIELVEQFFNVLEHEEVDVVLGKRVKRNDPLLTRLSSGLFWWGYRRWVQIEMPPGGIDTFGCNQDVRDVLLRMDESHSSLLGQLIWLGFRRKTIPYTRAKRVAGKSAWTLHKRFKYAFDSIFSFSDLPIRLLTLIGVVGVASSLLLSLIIFFAWWIGLIQVSGYTPLMLGLLFSTSSVLFSQGIIGTYVWRVFENSKQRPLAVTRLHQSFNNRNDHKESDGDIYPFKRIV